MFGECDMTGARVRRSRNVKGSGQKCVVYFGTDKNVWVTYDVPSCYLVREMEQPVVVHSAAELELSRN